tara:strand:- start:12451 stop:12624 length:174 start_codon:yes stop_codon:yes gene_type:complete
MLKVKTKYLNQKPPHCGITLAEFSQKQLKNLPEYLRNEYCVEEKPKPKKVKKDGLED